MSDSSLLSSLRSSFATTSQVAPQTSTEPVVINQPSASGVAAPAAAPATDVVSSTKKRLVIPQSIRDKIAKRQAAASITTSDQLDALGGVLNEIEAEKQASESTPLAVEPSPPGVVSAPVDTAPAPLDAVPAVVVPQTILQTTNTLNPAQPVGTTTKESQTASALEQVAAEMGTSLQIVEQEKSPELPPEVESFLHKVEEHQDQAPQEIVLAGANAQTPSTIHHPSQPVIVLPITPDIEKKGSQANVHWSVRWLVEWSHKIIKMFSGKVIYKEVQTNA